MLERCIFGLKQDIFLALFLNLMFSFIVNDAVASIIDILEA